MDQFNNRGVQQYQAQQEATVPTQRRTCLMNRPQCSLLAKPARNTSSLASSARRVIGCVAAPDTVMLVIAACCGAAALASWTNKALITATGTLFEILPGQPAEPSDALRQLTPEDRT
jgi:hypothetical protein